MLRPIACAYHSCCARCVPTSFQLIENTKLSVQSIMGATANMGSRRNDNSALDASAHIGLTCADIGEGRELIFPVFDTTSCAPRAASTAPGPA
jgi:hypothetical protein